MSTAKKLSTTLFSTILIYSLLVVMFFALAFSALFHFANEASAERRLSSIAFTVSQELNAQPGQDVEQLQSQFKEGIRYTLIAPDGSVLYDSQGAVTENHADRPEFQKATENYRSSVMRFSRTVGEDTIYEAVKLNDGNVVRLSEVRQSYAALLRSLAPSLFGALAIVAILSVVIARLLTRRIMNPLNNINVSRPLEHGVYQEMQPLLARIDEQQRQLKDQNEELARAENLRREFSANVSHEMKTPLQVISGYAELLSHGDIPPDQVQRFAGIALQEAHNMGALIDDVLMLSRLDDPVLEYAGKEELELLELSKEVVDRLRPVSEKHDVAVRVLGSTATVFGNRGLLEQLIKNIVSNAIRYSDPSNEVSVFVGKNVLPEDGRSGPEAFVRVKDAGCGIAPDEQKKIFERFYRTDKSRSRENGGTGLGLAIAKHAADFHGATITLESAPGKGSIFTVHFPLST